MSNLRVVYDNAADRATLAASSTAGSLVVNNMLSDIKSEVWRSQGPTATVTVTWPDAGELIGMVALPFCSLSSGATVRVRAYETLAAALPVLDTGVVIAAAAPPFDVWGWGSEPLGVNAYAYGGGTYGVVWFNTIITAQKLVIDIDDTSNPLGYIECSRLVTGTYWEPVNNADFGVEIGVGDLSKHERSDAGDLRTDRGAIYKTMSMDLSIMPAQDRNAMWRILRGNGMSRPIYLSLVPQAQDAFEEQAFQIYGKLSRQSALRYQFVNQYSSQLEIEEI